MDQLPIPGPVQVLIDWLIFIIATIIGYFNPKEDKPAETPEP